MLESQTVEIDGAVYGVQPLPARQSLKFLAHLGRLVGDSATGLLVAAAGSGGKLASADVGALASVVKPLCDKLTDSELEAVMRTLLATSTRDKKPLWGTNGAGVDTAFLGNPGGLFKLLAHALVVNYGELFAGLLAKGASATETTEAPSSSPPT